VDQIVDGKVITILEGGYNLENLAVGSE